MKRYRVGGTVRDRLLGLPRQDQDWLVIDASAQDLLALGYQQVGRDFPVFLHPQTHEEHALPRGNGGLEDDLARRDLTLNAMAEDEQGDIVDPLGGRQDIEQRLLRHTPHFADDPIRILRLARFAARYEALGFHVAEDTAALVTEMLATGALDEPVAERVWSEIRKALALPNPQSFFRVLRELGALTRLLPELDALFGVPQPERYHPEIDSGVHSLMVLKQAARLDEDPMTRFAALLHDLGKGRTSEAILPSHHGHEERGADLADGLCRRLRTPKDWRRLAVATARFHTHCHRAFELKPKTLLKLMRGLDAFRRPDQWRRFLLACEADVRGRLGFEDREYRQPAFLQACYEAAMQATRALPPVADERRPEQVERCRQRAIAECAQNYPQELRGCY